MSWLDASCVFWRTWWWYRRPNNLDWEASRRYNEAIDLQRCTIWGMCHCRNHIRVSWFQVDSFRYRRRCMGCKTVRRWSNQVYRINQTMMSSIQGVAVLVSRRRKDSHEGKYYVTMSCFMKRTSVTASCNWHKYSNAYVVYIYLNLLKVWSTKAWR